MLQPLTVILVIYLSFLYSCYIFTFFVFFFFREPHIKNLLSLRNVISEVCKHQLYQNDPVVTSFEDFYHNIETDRFEKLHFTTNYTQFYQNKFETEDGAMAIVFANGDVINNVSDSKLMYVDASFKIETNENFSYQLVTVLVWVEDSVSNFFCFNFATAYYSGKI